MTKDEREKVKTLLRAALDLGPRCAQHGCSEPPTYIFQRNAFFLCDKHKPKPDSGWNETISATQMREIAEFLNSEDE